MCTFVGAISFWLSDAVLFPASQILLVLFALFSAVRSRQIIHGGGFSAQVNRGPQSMAVFYGFYVSLSGVVVALCLGVDAAKNHRLLFVVFDLVLVAYLCLGSNWFRNKLMGWSAALTKLEKR